MITTRVVVAFLAIFHSWTAAIDAPTILPTPAPTLYPTHTPTSTPTVAPSTPTSMPTPPPTGLPVPEPTARPTHLPTPQPTMTPEPSSTPNPSPKPSVAPSPLPTLPPTMPPSPAPSQTPTLEPSASPAPSPKPTPQPRPLPTLAPTKVADHYPIYRVTALVRCLTSSGATHAFGAVDHEYGLSLKARVDHREVNETVLREAVEYASNPDKALFKGLGRVNSQGQHVDSDVALSAGDLSCDPSQGGGPHMLALINSHPIGSASFLDFRESAAGGVFDAFGASMSSHADAAYELTEVCLEQQTPSGQLPAGHEGVEVDFIVQRVDVFGTRTFVANATVDMHGLFSQDTAKCAALHPLDYDLQVGGWKNLSMLMQNAIPWEMGLTSEFDAEVSLLAFPWDDEVTDRRDRAGLTLQYGEFVTSFTQPGDYKVKGFENPMGALADTTYQGFDLRRTLHGYTLKTAYDALAAQGDPNAGVVELCGAACVAGGGAYQSWHPHLVVQWNLTQSAGNPNSTWAQVATSTWGKPLKLTDERRFFAVTYDTTPPTMTVDVSSAQFTYAHNISKCGAAQYVKKPVNKNEDGGFIKEKTPFPDRQNVRTGANIGMDCLPTSTSDKLEMNFTANEEGTYYLYAHPSFDQRGLERNFSGLVGQKWPYSITTTQLYAKVVLCGLDSTLALTPGLCDSVGEFPRTHRTLVPMDAEAFIFGYDFSFSEFAVYSFAEDDGWASEHSGFGLNRAVGLSEFQAVYGNMSGVSEKLLWPQLVEELSAKYVDNNPEQVDDEIERKLLPLTSRANYYNESDWSSSRFLLNSAKESNLSQVVSLVPDEARGFTTEFGTVAKVHFTLSKYADEFDYKSHREKYYSTLLNNEDLDVVTDNVYRNNVNSFYTNTDSFVAFQSSIGRAESQKGDNSLFPLVRLGYNVTRNQDMETVFVPDSSNKAEAVAASDPSGGGGVAPIIVGMNQTRFSDDHFFMIGQRDGVADGDQLVYAQVRLLYSNDPLFQFVPVGSIAQVPIWNLELESLLPDSSTVMDDTGWSPERSLPVVNVTAKGNVDYTTDLGGLCTLLVSLSEKPSGFVKFNLAVPDKSQAQLFQNQYPVLLFSPDNYQDLEVTLEGLDDSNDSSGDVPFDVVFALADTEDPRFRNRYDEFNFATTLTNLAIKHETSNARLAIGFNATFCQTSERGGWCDVQLQVCARNAHGGNEARCDDQVPNSLSGTPFSSLPIFTSGADKIVVKLNVSNRFESEIVGISGNGRFDASESSVQCEQGARGKGGLEGSLEGGCTATAVFMPFAQDGDGDASSRAWQGDGQGPYIAYIRLQGVDDFLVDGLQPNILSISSASVVRGREQTGDFVLYKEKQAVQNVDDDTSTVRLGGNRFGGSRAPSRYLEVAPPSCSTSESSLVGSCPVTVTASFELLNRSVTTPLDTVTCAKVSLDFTWYFDNSTKPEDAVARLTSQITKPSLLAGPAYDHYGERPKLVVSDKYTTDGSNPYTLEGWVVPDIPQGFLKGGQERGGLNAAYRAREDFCLPPGNHTGTLANVSTLFVPNGGSKHGGWVASIFVTGTDNVLWSSLGLPNKPNADQLGNFTYEVPTAGIPINLQGRPPESLELEVVVGGASSGGSLSLTNLVATDNAVNTSTVVGAQYTTRKWSCSSTCQVSFELDSTDDDVDDDDETYSVTATIFNVSFAGTPVDGESIVTLSSYSQWTVLPVTHYDDDTAGLLLEATDSPPLRSYRTDLLLPSDHAAAAAANDGDGWVGGRRFFGMKHNITSEGYRLDSYGDPQHRNATYFNVSLTSQPRHDVTVMVKAQPVQNEWGWQFEGVPAEGYTVKSYESPSPWIKGTNDSVADPRTGGLELTFTATNWMVPRPVVVMGLDDFLDDGDRDYTLSLEAASSDKYYDSGASMDGWANMSKLEQEQYPRSGAYLPVVTVPLRNLDDDEASFVAYQNGTRCSEPFYDYDAGIQFYLTSKPVSLVSVWVSSSDPKEAGPAANLVGITRDNWEFMKDVRIKSLDDFVADGNINFTVTLDLYYSMDAQYSNAQLYAGNTFQFVSMDDPNDGMGMGEAAVEVTLTSALDYTSALGGEMVELGVKLSYQPQAPVYLAVTTSNQLQGVVVSKPNLVFTRENYAIEQAVSVVGVDDGSRDGDTTYQVILGLEATDDPYYQRFAFSARDKTVVHNVVSRDYPWARVRLAVSADSTTTKEDDSSTGMFTAVTVGLCEALFDPVELGGEPGTQTSLTMGTDLCGGYWLVPEEVFGTQQDPKVSFVTVVVQVSDTKEAVLSCAPAAYACGVSFDGKTATLVFDRTGYPDLSSITPQLRVTGVNDFAFEDDDANDDNGVFQVTVSSASIKYFKERHQVLEGYLPEALSMVNQDDDQTESKRNAWYSVRPAVGCSVFESPHDAQMEGGNCVLDFSFHNAMKRGLGGERYAFTVTVDVSTMGSDVYIKAVPNISQGLHWNSTCELGMPGCTTLTLSFLEGENDFNPKDVPFKKLSLLDNPDDPLIRFGNMSASISLATVNEFEDDSDKAFQVVTDGLVGYNCSNGTLFLDCGEYVDSGNLTYVVEGMEYDDDTAGVVFSQQTREGAATDMGNNVTFSALRTGRTDGTDDDDTSLRSISLPQNVTSEGGDRTVVFGVALTSAPSDEVTVAITTQFLDDEWGLDRVEGVPTLNGSIIDGGGYKVARYKTSKEGSSWLNESSSKDYVTNKDTGRLLLTFTPVNWNETQEVEVVGLDDLAADGDKEYNLYATVNGSAGDMYHYDPFEEGFTQPARMPLVNLDNEQQTPGWHVKQNGYEVGEPFFGDMVGSIEFHPLTEPSDVIILSFSSNKPWVANTSETLVVISPSDWDQTRTVYVTAVDNFEDDGNIGFQVEMLMLGSSDQMYGSLIQNQTFSFVKVDDPEDSVYYEGVGMEFQFGANLYGVVQPFTTEYGGDGAMLDEVAMTGSATVQARLALKPQDLVTYSVTVSDASEGQVLYPSTVVFGPDNWNEFQEVVVLGRSDGIADGDVDYELEFNLVSTNDPYYRVLSLNDTSFTITNQDTIEQRVALGISSLGCYNITEGNAFSRGFQVGGDATCTVTVSLCLSDTEGGCSKKLTAQEVYNTSENLGVDSIAIWAYVGDRRVAHLAQPMDYNSRQINVTANGTEAHVVLGVGRALETAFNLTVLATDDFKDEVKQLDTQLTFYGVLRKGGKAVQEFVNYYDDFGDVTALGSLVGSSLEGTLGGETVRTGSVAVHTRDDETPRVVFYKASQGCNTGEYGRIDTPGQLVSEGACVLFLRLGSQPSLTTGQEVEITVASSSADAGLFAFSASGTEVVTDSVDFENPAFPDTFTDSFTVSFTRENWHVPVKVVLVGQDDTNAEGDQLYQVVATVDASPDANYVGQAVSLSFLNLEDDTDLMNVTQGGRSVGARTAVSVDEAGWDGEACRAFTVVVHEDLWLAGLGDGGLNLKSSLTLTTSDGTEGLVGTSCDPNPTAPLASTYAQSVSVNPETVSSEVNFITKRGRGAVFYYIGVDDDDNDGDVEFAITVTVQRPTYTTGGTTTEGESAEFTFFVTNYDDDSLVLANPLVAGERESKLTSNAATGAHTLTLFEPPECPSVTGGGGVRGCADACANAQANGDKYEAVSCSAPLASGVDDSVESNRTAKLSFSYPDLGTWNGTDFTKVRVTFAFTSNVGRFQLNFGVKNGSSSSSGVATTCDDAAMQDYADPSVSGSCWVEFDQADQSLFMFVTALADEVDRGDFVQSFLDVTTHMYFRSSVGSSSSFAADEPTLFSRPAARPYAGSALLSKTARTQRITLSIVEDDLAGLVVNQTSAWAPGGVLTPVEFGQAAYRSGARNKQVQDGTSNVSTISLPARTTHEAGGNVSFSVALTSEPLVGAYVYVWAAPVARQDGSETRYEGIPWPSNYEWTKHHPFGEFARLQSEDQVPIKGWQEGHKRLHFTPGNWQEQQDVSIVGLNDFYDDSTVDYTVYLTTVSLSNTEDPWYDRIGNVALPLSNTDDDVAGLAAYWDHYHHGPSVGTVSEPYLGQSATLFFYLQSKPTDTVLVTLVSNSPDQAATDLSVAAIGPSDWDSPRAALVTGVDNAVREGDASFAVSVSVVYSGDSDYGDALANEDGVAGRMSVSMEGISLDDPTDHPATSCGKGELGTYGNPVSNCSACQAGTYADEVGDKTTCRSCPPGTFGAYRGSTALTAATFYDGSLRPPGCLPCPNGTYSSGFGATRCEPCPAGKHCWPLATVTPQREQPWERYSTNFDKRWTQVSSAPYKAVVWIAGGAKEMNRDQYESYLIISGFGAWLLLGGVLLLFYLKGSHASRDKMVRFFRLLDLFPHSHEEHSKSEEHAGSPHAPSALGGVVSFGVLLLGLLTSSILFYVYVNFNVVATSTLDVYNTSFVKHTKVDLTARVTFVGFSGCSNTTYLPASIGEATVPDMVVTGASFESRKAAYQCSDGNLEMELALGRVKVETNPKLAFGVVPVCSACEDSNAKPRFSNNVVLACPACTVASAQAVKYSLEASQTYNQAQGLHGKDDNFVNGSEAPSSKNEVFRGLDATEVKVLLMPSEYENRRSWKKFKSYRLVYAESDLGSTQGFDGAFGFYGGGSSLAKGAAGSTVQGGEARNFTAPDNYERWVKDGSWAEEGAHNEVHFTLNLPLASSRVSVLVDNQGTFLDLWARLGGVLGLLVAVMVLGMGFVERSHDSDDPFGRAASKVHQWYKRKAVEWHDRRNPAAETWKMGAIDKMRGDDGRPIQATAQSPYQEEASTGEEKASPQEMDASSSRMFQRKKSFTKKQASSVGGARSQLYEEEEEEEDYEDEVDDFHGQI